jgi:hypothetical protein
LPQAESFNNNAVMASPKLKPGQAIARVHYEDQEIENPLNWRVGGAVQCKWFEALLMVAKSEF